MRAVEFRDWTDRKVSLEYVFERTALAKFFGKKVELRKFLSTSLASNIPTWRERVCAVESWTARIVAKYSPSKVLCVSFVELGILLAPVARDRR